MAARLQAMLDAIKRGDLVELNLKLNSCTLAGQPHDLQARTAIGPPSAGAGLTDKGDTLLSWACRHGQAAVARWLLDRGADVNGTTATRGGTALLIACQEGHVNCVQLLCDGGATIELANSMGATPLFIASRYGNADCVRLLLSLGATASTVREDGSSALFKACQKNHTECVKLLCDAGAAVNSVRRGGATALCVACQKGHVECVRLVCDAAADVNIARQDKVTPILMACSRGKLDCVRLLSARGASREAVQPWGSPESQAQRHGHAELLAWLKESHDWTPLHHIEELTVERARTLLRSGADLHAGSPSPLERARRVGGNVSALLLRAARWSEASHGLFPEAARAQAVAVLRLGYLLASARYETEAASLIDAWRHIVLPHAMAP